MLSPAARSNDSTAIASALTSVAERTPAWWRARRRRRRAYAARRLARSPGRNQDRSRSPRRAPGDRPSEKWRQWSQRVALGATSSSSTSAAAAPAWSMRSISSRTNTEWRPAARPAARACAPSGRSRRTARVRPDLRAPGAKSIGHVSARVAARCPPGGPPASGCPPDSCRNIRRVGWCEARFDVACAIPGGERPQDAALPLDPPPCLGWNPARDSENVSVAFPERPLEDGLVVSDLVPQPPQPLQ